MSELLGLARSNWYYQKQGENEYNLQLMKLIDEQYTQTPFYGVRRMTAWLKRQGHQVNRKRVGRLMKQMGLETIYPRPKLSKSEEHHQRYPYLLKDVTVNSSN